MVWRSSLYGTLQRFANAAEDLSAAMRLEPSAAVDEELLCFRGRCLVHLGDPKKAKADFLKFVETSQNSEALARALYDLAQIAFFEKDQSRGRAYYKSAKDAEERCGLLVESGAKTMCEMFMTDSTSHSGGLRECHHCGSVAKLQACSVCKAVAYCSRECQKLAWKKHKLVCQQMAAQRLEKRVEEEGEKLEAEANRAQKRGSKPLDYEITGEQLWSEGVALVASEQLEEAAHKFCYAVFVNNSLDSRMHEGEVRKVIEQLDGRDSKQGNSFAAILHALTINEGSACVRHLEDIWNRVASSRAGPCLDLSRLVISRHKLPCYAISETWDSS